MTNRIAYTSNFNHHPTYPNKIYEYELYKSQLALSRMRELTKESRKSQQKTHEPPALSSDLGISKYEAETAKNAYIASAGIFSDANLTSRELEVKKYTIRSSMNFFPNGKYRLNKHKEIKTGVWKDVKQDSIGFVKDSQDLEGVEIKGIKEGRDTKAFITYDPVNKEYFEHIISERDNNTKIVDVSGSSPALEVKKLTAQVIESFDDISNICIYEE